MVWDQTLRLCVKYRDLPIDTILAINVWPSNNTTLVGVGSEQKAKRLKPTGGCTLRLFSKKLRLRSGSRKLRLWKGQVAEGDDPSKTPGKIPVNERYVNSKKQFVSLSLCLSTCFVFANTVISYQHSFPFSLNELNTDDGVGDHFSFFFPIQKYKKGQDRDA